MLTRIDLLFVFKHQRMQRRTRRRKAHVGIAVLIKPFCICFNQRLRPLRGPHMSRHEKQKDLYRGLWAKSLK